MTELWFRRAFVLPLFALLFVTDTDAMTTNHLARVGVGRCLGNQAFLARRGRLIRQVVTTTTLLASSSLSSSRKSDQEEGSVKHCALSSLSQQEKKTLTYVEFYSGVGGWTMALHEALHHGERHNIANGPISSLGFQRLAALDHSDLCHSVLQYNFPSSDATQTGISKKKRRKESANHKPMEYQNQSNEKPQSIERLSLKQVEEWSASIFVMSPPCQPHTRQHSNQEKDLDDPRSKSFLHLCDLMQQMDESTLPRIVLMENVVGFELSGSCQRLREVMSERKYVVAHFHLNPTQVGIPNERPRYYCVAVRKKYLTRNAASTNTSSSLLKDILQEEFDIDTTKPVIQKSIVSLGVQPQPRNEEEEAKEQDSMEPISSFLDYDADGNNNSGDTYRNEALRIPDKILESNSSWCFDIVTPKDKRSACFTQSYGKFVRGTGSVLYTGLPTSSSLPQKGATRKDAEKCFQLVAPDLRTFDPNWSDGLNLKRDLRYFSGREIGRLMGFPMHDDDKDGDASPTTTATTGKGQITNTTSSRNGLSFSFPETCTIKQQRKLLGNSLNIRVVSRIAWLGLSVVDWTLD